MIEKIDNIDIDVNYEQLEVVFTDNNESKKLYFNNQYSINKFLDGLV